MSATKINDNKITIKNGETIHYLDYGYGPKTILLIHGNLCSALIYKNIISKFNKIKHRVIIPTLRGFGNSSSFRKIEKISDYKDDLLYLIEVLKLKDLTIIGVELGGLVAMELAVDKNVSLVKLILVNSYSHKGYPIFKKNSKQESILGAVYQSKYEMMNDPRDVGPIIKMIKEQDETNLFKYLRDNFYDDKNVSLEILNLRVEEALKQKNIEDVLWAVANHNMSHKHNYYNIGSNSINNIKVPVLHFWSERNKLIPEYMVLDNVAALKQHSKYIKLKESQYFSFDSDDNSIIEMIEDFIENH